MSKNAFEDFVNQLTDKEKRELVAGRQIGKYVWNTNRYIMPDGETDPLNGRFACVMVKVSLDDLLEDTDQVMSRELHVYKTNDQSFKSWCDAMPVAMWNVDETVRLHPSEIFKMTGGDYQLNIVGSEGWLLISNEKIIYSGLLTDKNFETIRSYWMYDEQLSAKANGETEAT